MNDGYNDGDLLMVNQIAKNASNKIFQGNSWLMRPKMTNKNNSRGYIHVNDDDVMMTCNGS